MEIRRPSPEDYADPVDRKLVEDMDWQGVPSTVQLIPPPVTTPTDFTFVPRRADRGLQERWFDKLADLRMAGGE